MQYLTEEKELIIKNNCCIYFYATWMPFHKKMASMISKIEENYKEKNIVFYAVDVDFFKNFCQRFNIDSVPTIIIFNENKEVKRINGVVLTSAFKKIFIDIFNKKR